MRDDDMEDWGAGCIGIGSVHEIGGGPPKKNKRAIGFVHFPEVQPDKKKRRRVRPQDQKRKGGKR